MCCAGFFGGRCGLGRQQLDLREPFIHKLVPVVVETMGGAFPELKKNPEHVLRLSRMKRLALGERWIGELSFSSESSQSRRASLKLQSLAVDA